MKEEVFGPILPVLEFDDIEDAIQFVNEQPTPLCLYIFSSSPRTHKQLIENTSSGTIGINETKLQFANPNLPFGGKGNSGMGKYHGKSSFDTFTHYRSVLHKKNKIDFSMRYPVYKEMNLKLLKYFLK
jgi:aldehyde dehydrogenase (NAD+)